MWKFEYVVLLHPGEDGEGETVELVSDTCLAKSADHARILAGRAIPEENINDLDRISIQVRRFRDDNTG